MDLLIETWMRMRRSVTETVIQSDTVRKSVMQRIIVEALWEYTISPPSPSFPLGISCLEPMQRSQRFDRQHNKSPGQCFTAMRRREASYLRDTVIRRFIKKLSHKELPKLFIVNSRQDEEEVRRGVGCLLQTERNSSV